MYIYIYMYIYIHIYTYTVKNLAWPPARVSFKLCSTPVTRSEPNLQQIRSFFRNSWRLAEKRHGKSTRNRLQPSPNFAKRSHCNQGRPNSACLRRRSSSLVQSMAFHPLAAPRKTTGLPERSTAQVPVVCYAHVNGLPYPPSAVEYL